MPKSLKSVLKPVTTKTRAINPKSVEFKNLVNIITLIKAKKAISKLSKEAHLKPKIKFSLLTNYFIFRNHVKNQLFNKFSRLYFIDFF